jgi:hypothetical protein
MICSESSWLLEREKPPQPKKESNKAEPILLDTSEKAKQQQFEVIAEDEGNSISLDLPNHLVINEWFFVGVSPFFCRNYIDVYFGVKIVTPIFCGQYITNIM